MEIMHTMVSEVIAQRPKRRCYSPELKTQVVAQCPAQLPDLALQVFDPLGLTGRDAFAHASNFFSRSTLAANYVVARSGI